MKEARGEKEGDRDKREERMGGEGGGRERDKRKEASPANVPQGKTGNTVC